MKKKRYILWFYTVCLLCILTGCNTHELLNVYDLRCEYLTEPLGIDNPYQIGAMTGFEDFSPRLTWKVKGKSETGKQRAYRLIVNNRGKTIWDSGVVESTSQFCFIPAGKLQSNSVYHWKVAVYNKDTGHCVWSDETRFTTGLAKNDWQGTWIYRAGTPKEQHIWYRKNFELEKVPPTVFAYVASCGYHELYVNGRKADDRILAPAVSRIDKRIFYVTYDISKFLTKGKNVIAVAYGPGWSTNNYFEYYGKTRQGILAQVYDGDKKKLVSTDTTWLCTESYSRNIGRFDFMDMGGELVDGRKFTEKWANVGFDDRNWEQAVVQTFVNEPILSAQMTEPSRIIDTIAAKKITKITYCKADTIYRVDMGEEFTGFLEASFNGLQPGDTVVMQISMRDSANVYVQATDTIGNQIIEEHEQKQIYIACGRNGETFRNRFNFFGGRYIHFRGLKYAPKLQDIKGLSISSAPEITATFECSDTLYNRIFALDKHTYQMCNTEGVTVDCPNRERLGYGPEGAYQTMWGVGLPVFNSAAYYVKNVRDWADVQREDGFINNVAPQVSEMYGCVLNGTAILNIAWEHYRMYGDKRILEMAYPVGMKWLDFLDKYMKNSMLTPYGEHGYFLGEWVSPGPVFEYAETEAAVYNNNCAYAATLDYMIKIAAACHKPQTASRDYSEKLQKLRVAMHKKYFNPEKESYLNGDQVRTAWALYAGIVPNSLKEKVETHLLNLFEKQQYLDIGSFGRYPFYKIVLGSDKYTEALGEILARKTYPSYGWFVEKGCTTLPEMWEIDLPNSTVIHTSYTGISAFFIKYLAGINEESCAYDTILIEPHTISHLQHCRAEIETPYGKVKSAWEKENNEKIQYGFIIPFGAVAKIRLENGDERIVPAGNYTFNM